MKARSCPPCYGLHPLWALAPCLQNIDSYGLHVLPIAAIHISIVLSLGSEFFIKLISIQALEQLLLVLPEDKLGWNGRNTERKHQKVYMKLDQSISKLLVPFARILEFAHCTYAGGQKTTSTIPDFGIGWVSRFKGKSMQTSALYDL